ncbi:MAG: DUF721 domain-containing protein [Xanthomonadales bacterium]|nr:DUF721 domain-containing protein [Xanthomonadales bacterium]NIN59736.1 DUF721 domain-containing protein [Xanthomonadales bacterium]NIN75505.1 DUF721 domain-containing protein [Xanthomonadales bacterium]NIO15194.1 DUF721 domain-containing protein [Xanthomonadales bacterium]NIP12129.1 DUF721 domain-containing protein [Xanthomonadales bacterium]
MSPPDAPARRARPVNEWLRTRGAGFGELLARAREYQRLEQVLGRLLAPELAALTRIAVRHEARLVLVTSSAAVAARLRLDSQRLLQDLAEAGTTGIAELEVRVAPLPAGTTPERTRRPLSPAARQALDRFARDSGDPEIEAIIRGSGKPPKRT